MISLEVRMEKILNEVMKKGYKDVDDFLCHHFDKLSESEQQLARMVGIKPVS